MHIRLEMLHQKLTQAKIRAGLDNRAEMWYNKNVEAIRLAAYLGSSGLKLITLTQTEPSGYGQTAHFLL